LGDGVEVGLGQGLEVQSSGEVLAQQTVGVLVAAPLPGRVRIAEEHPHPGFDGEPLMLGHLMSQVPGQRLGQLPGRGGDRGGQGVGDRVGLMGAAGQSPHD
jgi:hypothetical protein